MTRITKEMSCFPALRFGALYMILDICQRLNSKIQMPTVTGTVKLNSRLGYPTVPPGIRMWRARSIITMRSGDNTMYSDPSIYSYNTEFERREASLRLKAPSIISTALSTLSEDTFYAGRSQTDPYKVLLVGVSQTGKSTIIKQLKIAYGEGFSNSERESLFEVVFQSFATAVQTVVDYMNEKNIGYKYGYQKLLRLSTWEYSQEYVEEAIILLKDPAVVEILKSDWARYRLDTSKQYFLDQASRFKYSSFLPSDDDIIHANHGTTGIWETDLKMRNLHIRVYDVGESRSERRKWIHRFESITSVIFCAALDDYYKVIPEGDYTSRMEESIVIFDAIHSSRWFAGKPTILLLNKFDVFKEILQKIPLQDPEYHGGGDVSKAVGFILQRYRKCVESIQKPIYPHLLQATDWRNVRQVFRTVRDEILMTALEDHVVNLKLVD
ncbi:G-protein alpha subunit-domain-containing protein [Cyathus striatus]|nr:G-protein alpha subunit-domain-containing protein [Cyathus striatus]